MKIHKGYTLDYRRKREGKTSYKSRLKLLASDKLRVVVRRKLNNVSVQIIKFDSSSDIILISSYTRELLKYGWTAHRGNLPSSYLVGLLCGLKAKKTGLKSGVLDLGLHRAIKKSSFFAVVKGLRDAGFDIPVNEEIFPDHNRIIGKHIEDYAKKLKGSNDYEKRFSTYLKSGLKPEELTKHFEDVKKRINEKWH